MHRFPPRMPVCTPAVDAPELLDVIRDRLVSLAWHDGRRGFTTDKALLERHVNLFVERYLSNKTLSQLALIEAIPELHITPQLLQQAGLVHKQVTDEHHVLYWKAVKGDEAALSKMGKSQRVLTANRSKDFEAFLRDSPSSPHIQKLDAPPRNSSEPYPFHVGRLSVGVSARRDHERREERGFKPQKGARMWAEAVVHGGGAMQIEYWVLSSAELLFGQEWVDHMVSANQGGNEAPSSFISDGESYYSAVSSPIRG